MSYEDDEEERRRKRREEDDNELTNPLSPFNVIGGVFEIFDGDFGNGVGGGGFDGGGGSSGGGGASGDF